MKLTPAARARSLPYECPERIALLALLGFLLLLLQPGCAVCIPRPVSRNVARSGGVRRAVPILDAVREGVSTRSDLEEILLPFLTTASDENFLWARWEQVSSPIACSTADEGKDWSRVNVLAVFDERGLLKHYRRCSDRHLLDSLAFMAEHAAPPTPTLEPLLFAVFHHGTFVTSKTFGGRASVDASGLHIQAGFQQMGSRFDHVIHPAQIQKVTIQDSGNTAAIDVHFAFRRGTAPVSSLMTYQATARDVWRLVWCLRAAAPALLRSARDPRPSPSPEPSAPSPSVPAP
jgi:hypothetical protein